MSHDFEEKVDRLAFDLRTARTNDATNVIREELRCNPEDTLALVRAAEQMNRGRSMDHVIVRPDGDILITDPYRNAPAFVGQLPPCIEDRRDNYYRGQSVPRYGDRGGCFGNGSYDDYDRDRDYDRRPPVVYEPRYQQREPLYIPPDRYENDRYQNYGYRNENYGYHRNNNTARDIAIGVVGGIILDRAINRR